MPKKALICDLNGVLLQGEFLSERIRKDYAIPGNEFVPILLSILNHVQRPGAKGMYELFQPYLKS